MARWTEDLSNQSRHITTDSIYSWAGARAGDTWLFNREKKVITKVTKTVDPDYNAIWYSLEFEDGTGSLCADNMGHGTILVTGAKEIA
jgi:hypothetical protein